MLPSSLAHLLRVLSTERRVTLLRTMMSYDEPIISSNLAALSGESDATTSWNLGELAKVGLVMRRQVGRHVYYAPNREMILQVFEYFNVKTITPKESPDESLRSPTESA